MARRAFDVSTAAGKALAALAIFLTACGSDAPGTTGGAGTAGGGTAGSGGRIGTAGSTGAAGSIGAAGSMGAGGTGTGGSTSAGASGRSDAGTTDGSLPGPAADGGPPGMADKFGTLVNGGGVKNSGKSFEDRVYDFQFTVAPADWKMLNDNAEAFDTMSKVIPAMLKIDGQDLGRVGLRYKGAWGTFRTCLQGATGTTGGRVPAQPIAGCTNKFPFKVDFGAFDAMARWNGLKKVNLHSHLRDPAKMREKLTFWLYRSMGIATARSTHAKVTVTVGAASVVGLFGLTENVTDGRFTEDHWPSDSNGNLWKQGWPMYVTAPYWLPKLETNTDPPPPATVTDKVLAFANDVYRNRDNTAAVLTALQKWTDTEWLARFMAVNTVAKDYDGVVKFWCPSPALMGCGNNNFLWYQLSKQDKFLLIPWDVDSSWYIPADHDVIPPWDKLVASCAMPYMLYGASHMAPSCDPVFKALNTVRPLYLQAIRDMLAGPLNVPAVHADIDRWVTYLRPAVMAGTRQVIDGTTFDFSLAPAAWDTEVRRLKTNVQMLRDRIAGVLEGRDFR